jgi:ornithine carbamoyltransferase
MNTQLRGRDFITMKGYSKEDLETILHLAFDLKMKRASGEPHALLVGKNLGMLFGASSTRTRISFETGMAQLGGQAQFYTPEQLQLSKESWVDTAQVMSRYLDGLVVRMSSVPNVRELEYGEGHDIINTIANNANIPVISAACDKEHPCQVMADIMTMIEKCGPDYKRKKVAIVWVCSRWGKPTGVPHSMAIASGTLGMTLTLAYPEGFDLDPEYINEGKRLAEHSGGNIEIVHDINEAVKDASVIYGRGWGAVGKTREEDLSMREPFVDWNIRMEHFDAAAPNAVFMNSMPLDRERDAVPEVVDGPMSVIYDEAENRLHVQKAIMALLMG